MGVVSDSSTYYSADYPLSTANFDPRGTDYNFRVKGASGANNNIDTITAPSRGDGHILIVEGTDDTATVTFRDDQVGTNIKLGGSARILGDGDVLVLRYQHDGFWHELIHKPVNEGGGLRTITTEVDASAGGTAQTTTIGLIPANAILWDVHATVVTAFNGDATTTLEVGVIGNNDAYIDTSDFDPSSLGTQLSMQKGTNNDIKIPERSASARSVRAVWTNTASASAGLVEVTLLYSVLD